MNSTPSDWLWFRALSLVSTRLNALSVNGGMASTASPLTGQTLLMSLISPVAVAAAEDGVVSAASSPDRPVRRRSFAPSQKLKYLSEYETACETGGGNAYLCGGRLLSWLSFTSTVD